MKPVVLLFLCLAVASEIVATASLKASEGFTRLWPLALMVLAYGVSFFFLTLTLQHLPLGVVYAIWSGLGTAGAVLVGVLIWGESLSWVGVAAILLIVAGVVILNLVADRGST
jgi:multidrug transporter EmrE-like cation transporter